MSGKSDTLAEILALAPARRGQLSEQYLRRVRKDGTEVRNGPYYVLQWYEGGRKRSRRVSAADAPRVREELERGRKAEELIRKAEEGVWRELACPGSKKKAAGSARS